jgi:cardiolipin synthase
LRFTGGLASRAEQLFHDFEERRECGKEEWVNGSLLLPNYGVGCRYRWYCVLHQRLDEAAKRIWITTPYFVPDAATQRGLRNAALRGVDVRLLVPGKSDVPVVQWAARLSYDSLLRAGVRVFEFNGRVLHAKTMIIDEDWSSVGTANLDYRSLFINDELNLVTRSPRLNHELTDVFLDDLEHARRMVQEPRGKISLLRFAQGFIGWVARKWL